MKKRIPLILSLFAIFGLVSCGEEPVDPTPDDPTPVSCEHVDANNDHKCDKCGETISEHVDSNKDHKCDVCGASVSEHVDNNKDHKCDECGATISEHTDENPKDHYCDVCGEKLSDHVDANGDHNCDVCGEKMIPHQQQFVSSIESTSSTRDFDERFDKVVDDFSGATLNGTTDAVVEDSFLRVLVDNTSEGRPISNDASIYKMATGNYALQDYDSIGFKMRVTGNKELNLSNLVLALRGDDAWKTYPINLGTALDEDGSALPALSGEFQEFKISPQQSIEDGATEYDLADGSGKSGTKVLDSYLGFHLYSLDEECSAVLEISEVFITKAGEKTVLDSFNREKVNKTDGNQWWRDSTGFIVRKGINLKGKSYKTTKLQGQSSLVLTALGDSSGVTLSAGGKSVAWKDLKDEEGNSVSATVNGAYYNLAICLEKSGLPKDAEVTISSTTDFNISNVYTTSFEAPQAVLDYPTFDIDSFFMFDNFNGRTQSGFDGDYEKAIADQQTIDAGLAYQLSYHNGDRVTIHDGALVFEGGEDIDYIQYKACNDSFTMKADYMVMAVKCEDGATLDNFRINIGGSGVTYWNQWFSAEGLACAKPGQEGYEYVKDGYTWLIVDLAQSGITTMTEPNLDYYYSGLGKLSVNFVGFADKEKTEYDSTVCVEKSYADGQGYDYAGYVYSPKGSRYMVLETTSETGAKIDSIRFEPVGGSAMWFHEGNLKDAEGKAISGDTLAGGSITIDLVASGIKSENLEEIGIHVHGDGSNGQITAKISVLTEKVMTQSNVWVEKSYADGQGYDYAGYVWAGEGCQYLVLETTSETGAKIDSIRFEPVGGSAMWFHEGNLKDADGNVISGDTLAGGTITIDLVASGIKASAEEGIGIHVHGDGSNGQLSAKISTLDPIQETKSNLWVEKSYTDGQGYDYAGYVWAGEGCQYLVLETTSETGAKIDSIRFEPVGGSAMWFHEGNLKDADGNVISGDTLAGGTITIDLVASGIKASAEEGIGIHVHGDGSNGQLSAKISTIDPIPQYLTVELGTASTGNLGGYVYAGGFAPQGAKVVKVTVKSESGATLKTVRFEGNDGAKWIKDGAVFDKDGNPISGDTVVTSEGIELYIDLEASGLGGDYIHVHTGDFDGSVTSGDLSFTFAVEAKKGTVDFILWSIAG